MVVCVSHHSARVLAERGYFNSTTNVRVVHNGSPMEGIERVERAAGVTDGADGAATKGADGGLATRSGGETPETRSILCVARLDEHKGIDVLFRALARLGDLPVRLDLVGAGKAEGALREEAERLGLAPRIHWHGYATRDGVRDFSGAGRAARPSVPLRELSPRHPRGPARRPRDRGHDGGGASPRPCGTGRKRFSFRPRTPRRSRGAPAGNPGRRAPAKARGRGRRARRRVHLGPRRGANGTDLPRAPWLSGRRTPASKGTHSSGEPFPTRPTEPSIRAHLLIREGLSIRPQPSSRQEARWPAPSRAWAA